MAQEFTCCLVNSEPHNGYWLDSQAQGVVANGVRSCWWPVTSDVPQGSVLGPALFNILTDPMADDSRMSFSKTKC